MKGLLIFVFILLQSVSFSQVDTLEIEKPDYLPDSLFALYQELTETIDQDSTDSFALIERADLISGLNDIPYFFTIYGNEKVYQEAMNDYSKAIEISPYSHKPYFKRGLLKDRFLFYKEAVADYDEAYTYAWAKDAKIKIKIHRARLKAQLGEYDVAIKDLEKALLEDRENMGLLNTLALIYLDLDEYSKALKYLNRSLEFHPEDNLTLLNIGYVALNSGKFQKAINIFNEQVKNENPFGFVYSNRGFAKYKLGKNEEALEDLNEAIRINPINSYAYKNRAILYFETGENEKACADLLKAKEFGYTTQYDDEVIKLLFDHCIEFNKKPGEKN